MLKRTLLNSWEYNVIGIDPAQNNLGATITSVFGVYPLAVSGTNSFFCRKKSAVVVNDFVDEFIAELEDKGKRSAIDLAVIEDYTMQWRSFVAFGMGEMGGLIRDIFYERDIPFLLCPPNSMRSFCGIPPRTKSKVGKKKITAWAESEFDFKSDESRWNDRQNETDAFVHSIIGQCFLSYKLESTLPIELSEKQLKILGKLKERIQNE